MRLETFNTLLTAYKGQLLDRERIANDSFTSVDFADAAIKEAKNKGFIDSNGQITDKGLDSLAPFKVDNAIIMAAGLSSRCLPLSKVMPKGLFMVKGEVLIEREIRQLQEVGISEIILVTGYMAEKFDYLAEKYGVTIVNNTEYKVRNNTSSIMAARKYLANSYICCADNYFEDNVFQPYVYDSYYTCKTSDEFVDEFCLTDVDENGYIHEITRGGKGIYTMGAVFFSRSFSDRFIDLLTREYENDDVKGMLIDTYHIRHMDKLPSMYKVYSNDVIKEFDTISEFEEFDPEFKNFYNTSMEHSLFERYTDINRYAGVPTDRVTGRLHYNENLWGPSPKCLDALYQTTNEDLYLYDSSQDDDLLIELEKKLGISQDNLFLHNGSAETIKTIFSVMLNKGEYVLVPTPGWSYYTGLIDYKFGNVISYDIIEDGDKCVHNVNDILEKAKKYNPQIIVITSPAMPTGNAIKGEELELIIKSNPGSMVLVDEAYYGFREYDLDINRIISTYDNVVFSRTFSKYYALANLRVGYGICSQKAKHALWLDLPLHRLPHISKRLAIAALNDEQYYNEITREAIDTREWFWRELSKIDGVHPFKSDANFLYVGLSGYDVEGIKKYMEDNGYLIRIFDSHGKQHLRITIAPREIMDDCLNKLKAALSENHRNEKS